MRFVLFTYTDPDYAAHVARSDGGTVVGTKACSRSTAGYVIVPTAWLP